MSSLKLKHSGGNGVIIAAPSSNPASDRTLTVPSNADGEILTTTSPKTGNIIQIVHASYATTTTNTTTSFADSGLTATITPSSSSNKIVVMVAQPFRIGRTTASDASGTIQLYRSVSGSETAVTDNAGYLFYFDAGGLGTSNGLYFYDLYNVTVQDSPSTTSAVTYLTKARAYSSNTDIKTQYNGKSFITLMEVAG